MNRTKFYPLHSDSLISVLGKRPQRHGILTGEFRPPKAGEWYLSGAIPECYRAPNDLTTAYQIVRIAETETVTEIREKRT